MDAPHDGKSIEIAIVTMTFGKFETILFFCLVVLLSKARNVKATHESAAVWWVAFIQFIFLIKFIFVNIVHKFSL